MINCTPTWKFEKLVHIFSTTIHPRHLNQITTFILQYYLQICSETAYNTLTTMFFNKKMFYISDFYHKKQDHKFIF